MKGGPFTFVACCSSLAIAACSASTVQVRALPDPAAKLKQGGDELAAARGMLAVGSVGLALEGFRKLEIDEPTNPQVYAGIAQCYAAMGRYDLERYNYETALAYAPHDRSLLAAFANSLDHLGEPAKAAAVRGELAQAPLPAAHTSSESQPVVQPQVGSITVKLPPARPATAMKLPPPAAAAMPEPVLIAKATPIALMQAPGAPKIERAAPPVKVEVRPAKVEVAPVEIAMPKPVLSAVPVQIASVPAPQLKSAPVSPLTLPQLSAVAEPRIAQLPAKPIAAQPAPIRAIALQPVIAPAKPEPRRPDYPNTMALVAELQALEPAIKPRESERTLTAPQVANGPRLERLSMGEVALVTTSTPMWRTQMASSAVPGPVVRWLPIRSAEARPPIQLLNAARSQGLAAWTRMALVSRGWRRIDIGDYGEVRQRSLVLYSGDHAPLAHRLAAQLNCKAVKVGGKSEVLVLLGRDAASRKAASIRA